MREVKEDGRVIITTHVYPPIPIRQFDWQAHFDGDEPDDDGRMMTGHGATEQEAIEELLDRANDHCLTDDEQKSQAARCSCHGSDDYCVCQNVADGVTKAERRAALSASKVQR